MGSVKALRAMTELYPELRKRGLRVLPGGDYGFPNNPIGRNARDLELFVRLFGYSPAQALRATTHYGGQVMDLPVGPADAGLPGRRAGRARRAGPGRHGAAGPRQSPGHYAERSVLQAGRTAFSGVTRTIRRVPDLRYGEVLGFRPLELDLYVPDGLEGPVPVVVYVHGGGWQRGSRRDPPPLLDADFYDQIAAQGLAVAAVDYRLSGEARFPAPLQDVRAAVGWVRDHAADYGLDPGRVFLRGDSAGGHLALLAALTEFAAGAMVGAGWPGSR